jgi:DNA-binding GntR family transcriptional regulator
MPERHDSGTRDAAVAETEDVGGVTPERLDPPGLVQLAANSIRKMILSSTLRPGDRLVEERLAEQLGISRPPLREAIRLLQQEGLVTVLPRRGAQVAKISTQDVFEIFTLRSALERMAIELGVPVTDQRRLQRCRDALDAMAESARRKDRPSLIENAFEFHMAIVALAGHRRLEDIYRTLYMQMILCMAMNLHVREEFYEDLDRHVERHRNLLSLIESGDRDGALAELAEHGETSFAPTSGQPSPTDFSPSTHPADTKTPKAPHRTSLG